MKQNFHLEDSLVMYGIYNSDTLEKVIDTVHNLHNKTTWNEKYLCLTYSMVSI